MKQVALAVLIVYPFIALTAYFARNLLGHRTAFWFGVTLAVYVTIVFALLVVASLVASYTVDAVSWLAHRRRSRSSAISHS